MSKTFSIVIEGGMDHFLKLVSMLRNKGFDVRSISMHEFDSESSEILITMRETINNGVTQAIKNLNKVVGVQKFKLLEDDVA